ncbi:hypothetical protein K435DRAFT_861557 [Dendrothele bispora CBS 962.96]|uniref:Family A G protein-coupled receptor-like protein n=1 Tax=Dendrothele bispora (strain CBS 962.96) TaxID=1314807 RepID=A0A4S8LVL4_DENBC|nr:hypothetical protein K435DRAFT_861557 [Dendrothele bispora CBS 962.96]
MAAKTASKSLVLLFVALHTFVWTALTIITATVVLSRNVRRQVTWLNLNLSWIFACFAFSLLLITGQLSKPVPDASICLVQAAATISLPSLTSGATLAFALHLWFNIRSSQYQDKAEFKRTTLRNIALVVIPYIVPLVEFLAAFIYGAKHPEQVVLDGTGMLCGFTTTIFAKLAEISVCVLMFITVVFEALSISVIYRRHSNWKGRNYVAMLVRLLAFTLFGMLGIGASLTYLTSHGKNAATANLLQAIPPVSFVFIFGLQWDIIKAWMFWKTDDTKTSSAESMKQELHRSPTPVEVRIDLVRSTSYPGDRSDSKI